MRTMYPAKVRGAVGTGVGSGAAFFPRLVGMICAIGFWRKYVASSVWAWIHPSWRIRQPLKRRPPRWSARFATVDRIIEKCLEC